VRCFGAWHGSRAAEIEGGHAVTSLSDRGKGGGEKGCGGGTTHWRRGGKGEGVGAGSVTPRGGEWGLARPTGGVWPA
jgi:hypothetical protein